MADIKWSAFPTVASPTSGDTLVGLHSGANYQFTGLTIPFSGAVGGTGVANTGLTINLASGAIGKILTSDSSGNATWASPGYLTGAVLLAPSGIQTISTYGLVATAFTGGNILMTGNTLSSTNTNGNINLTPNGTGCVFLGTATQFGLFTTANGVQLCWPGHSAVLEMGSFVNNSGSNSLVMYKSRSTAVGSFTTVNTGDTIGAYSYYADTGSAFTNCANYLIIATGTVSAGVCPTLMKWSTANSSGVVTLGMTLDSTQNLVLANPLSAGSGGTGITSLGTGVATALGQNVTGSGGIVLANGPTFITSTVTAPSVTFSSTSGIIGTTTNNNAAAGSVGEEVESIITLASGGVSLTNATSADVTSISLTAGDWDVWGNVGFSGNGATLTAYTYGWISSTSATTPDAAYQSQLAFSANGATFTQGSIAFCAPGRRFSLTTTTTIYLSVNSGFSVSTEFAFGAIYARRRR